MLQDNDVQKTLVKIHKIYTCEVVHYKVKGDVVFLKINSFTSIFGEV